jgi:hypothetical protein
MNPNELNVLHLLHVVGLLVLAAYTFFAFAGPPDTRKRVMAITGIASLLVLLTGVRMWQGMFGFAMFGWIIVKLVCWLGLSALGGMAYRKRDKTNLLMTIALALLIVGVSMVYLKPF